MQEINGAGTNLVNEPYDSMIEIAYPQQPLAANERLDNLFEFISNKNNEDAPTIEIPSISLSPAQQMIVFQKLSSLIEESLLKTNFLQLEAMQTINKNQLEVSLKNLQKMIDKNLQQKAASRRSKIFAWVSRVAVLVVSAAVLAAVVVGSAGLAAGPAFVAVTALLSFFGAAYDVAGNAKAEADGKGFSLGQHLGSNIGAAALSGNFGALAGLGLQAAGDVPDWAVIVVTVAVTLVQMALTMKYTTAPDQVVVKFARLTEIAQKIGMSVNGLSLTLQGCSHLDSAVLNKAVSDIHALMMEQEMELIKRQEQIADRVSFVEQFQQALQSMARVATDAIGEMSRNIQSLSEMPDKKISIV